MARLLLILGMMAMPALSWGQQAATTFGPGTYLVNTDIKPGLYRTEGGVTYFERLSGLSGEFADIIANEAISRDTATPVVVEIKADDVAFKSQGAGTWYLVDDSYKPALKTSFGDGWWIVGKDILPGVYRTKDDVSYYARLSGFSHEFSDIITNEAGAEGGAIIEIKATDAGFETRGATWEAVSITAPGQSAVEATGWGEIKAMGGHPHP